MTTTPRLDNADSVFIDQSVITAFMDPVHPKYRKARSVLYDLDDLDRHLVTTNAVIFDIHEWLRNHYDYDHADAFFHVMNKAIEKESLSVLAVPTELEQKAKQFVAEAPQFQFSLSEALTVVVMLRYGIKRIFTFNSTYKQLPVLNPEIKVIPSVL
ncbi:type II toxin-antitoxin system VapC family toxin [Paenibacillus turpanensis]|uniref:type II toxin-antitoxin system VapC family toxin n=1 Tax=Paenibacillus turpanensis TaxID=2689078 RepID=UPI001409C5A7|nr:type II toxin-antitoxin system VapC family toxin [Paenibacillus turpanensis]